MSKDKENSSKKRKRMTRSEKRSQILYEGRHQSPLYMLAQSIRAGNYGSEKKDAFFWRKELKLHKKL
jgi:hypothetical protein